MIRHARAEGSVTLDGKDVLEVDVTNLRRRVGMVFQRPNPFPKSIFDNVAYGIRVNGLQRARTRCNDKVEHSLQRAALWDEVKDKLHESAYSLSGGQQQRLCIARALAVDPEVLLLDEPCSALDPIATAKIEDLMFSLKDQCTQVIVTHNMQQAARVAEFTGFFLLGKLIEFDRTAVIFQTTGEERDGRLHYGAIRVAASRTDRHFRESVKLTEDRMLHFREELEELQSKLLEMGGLVEASIHNSVYALVERDEEKAKEVMWDEALINQKEMEIDELATRLLALFQPMARDLRFITAVIKINSDLERMGDLAVNITERAMNLMKEPTLRPLVDIPRIAELAESMVHRSLDAFARGDAVMARDVLLADDEVDSPARRRLQRAAAVHGRRAHHHQSRGVADVHRAESGTDRRSCHEHRRGRAVSGEGNRRPPPRGDAGVERPLVRLGGFERGIDRDQAVDSGHPKERLQPVRDSDQAVSAAFAMA